MPDGAPNHSSIILYQTEDGRTRIQCRLEDDTIWLTQKLMAELFQKDVRTINEHVQNVFAEGELAEEAVIRKFRITAAEGVLRPRDQVCKTFRSSSVKLICGEIRMGPFSWSE